jgi:tetratricopeptide (TPR) repeat protein
VIGWIADFFRFWWALAYWNSRKTWFRLRGAHRDSCPCQTFSDSGLALDSRCEAIATWHDPRRFRKVCPLLTETKHGWRCGADAERVRPFWLRALAYTGAALLALYLLGSIALYATLRVTGYQVSYVTVVWPPRWPELRQSQELLYANRARDAMAAGDYQAAILSLQTVCLLNPQNTGAAFTLAHLLQLAGQATVAEHIYARLMQDVPEQRPAIAQVWVRLLLARGNYSAIKPLAIAMLSEDSSHREAWLHALLFAARQSNDPAVLGSVLSGEHGLPNWCVDFASTEQLLLQRQADRALPRLTRIYPATISPYVPYYQADRLLRIGQPDLAVNLVNAYPTVLPADEAAFLRLRAFRAKGWTSLAQPEFEGLMSLPLTPRLATLCSAYLLEWPDREFTRRFVQRFRTSAPTLSLETLALHQAVYLLAASSGLTDQAGELASQINAFTKSDGKALQGLGEVLRSGTSPQALTQLLPSIALPIEVIYALQGRPPAPVKS